MDDGSIALDLQVTFRAIAGPHKGETFCLQLHGTPVDGDPGSGVTEYIVTRKKREAVSQDGIFLTRDREGKSAGCLVDGRR